MGLTIHYKLRALQRIRDTEASGLVARMHAIAAAWQKAGRVEAVGPIGAEAEDLVWLNEWLQAPVPGCPETTRGIEVPVLEAHIFSVMPGADCEPLRLGLCRYPDRVPDHATGRMRAVRRRGWRLGGFCKTQYASLHGWEHFRRCHLAVVDLLGAFRRLGLRVWLMDEGNYWPDRDEAELRRSVDQMNRIVAGFAGALRDATDEDGRAPVQSPIFAHPQFEHLEAEGVQQAGASIDAAVELTRKQPRSDP